MSPRRPSQRAHLPAPPGRVDHSRTHPAHSDPAHTHTDPGPGAGGSRGRGGQRLPGGGGLHWAPLPAARVSRTGERGSDVE